MNENKSFTRNFNISTMFFNCAAGLGRSSVLVWYMYGFCRRVFLRSISAAFLLLPAVRALASSSDSAVPWIHPLGTAENKNVDKQNKAFQGAVCSCGTVRFSAVLPNRTKPHCTAPHLAVLKFIRTEPHRSTLHKNVPVNRERPWPLKASVFVMVWGSAVRFSTVLYRTAPHRTVGFCKNT